MIHYRLDRLEFGEPESNAATWAFGRRTVRGTEYRFPVKDGNQHSRNRWLFAVRVPDYAYGRIEIRALQLPNDSAFAGLDRRSLTFMRGTLTASAYRTYLNVRTSAMKSGS